MIIDASIALKWLVPEEGSQEAAALIGRGDLVVPTLFHSEVGNALWRKAIKKEIRLEELLPQLENLPTLVRTLDETALISNALQLAAALQHPIYDCVYLSLAAELDDQLVTADRRLLKAVEAHPIGERVVAL